MPSLTITDGYTFSNWGPLTTTYTAPASCATATGNYMLGLNTPSPVFLYEVQCSTDGYVGCIPTGTASVPLTLDNNPSALYHPAYYSPGLYCPSGWATVGVAGRDADSSLSLSGVLSISTTTASTETLPTTFAEFENPTPMLIDLLSPSETLVMCCPSSMTADLALGCYSTVPDYKVTEGCMRLMPNSDIGESTKTTVGDHTTAEELVAVLTATYPVSPSTTTFGTSEASELVAASVMPMLMLVRHQSDLRETGSGTAASTQASSTSNAAGKITLGTRNWDGLAASFGISMAAMVLGAAVVLSW